MLFTDKISQRKNVLIGALIVVAVIVTVTFISFLNFRKAPGESLVPKKSLLVNGQRYLNACQILPETSIDAIYGKLPQKSYIRETYLDRSINKDALESQPSQTLDTSCSYVFNDAKNRVLTTTVTYYPTAKEAQQSWQSSVNLGNGTYEKQLADFESTLAADQSAGKTSSEFDTASLNLIKFMRETLPKAKREAGSTVTGLDKSILFNSSRSSFVTVYKNSLITLKYEFGSSDPFDESRKISSDELSSVLGPIQKSFDLVFTNIDNPKLSQAPSPTLRDSKQKMVGATQILEPCEILDATLFETIIGKPNNVPVIEKQTTAKDPSMSRTHVDGYPILADNSCLRDYKKTDKNTDKDISHAYMSLELAYAKDSHEAQTHLNGLAKALGVDVLKKDSSDAELTYYRNTAAGSFLLQSMRFQKDGYVGTLTIAKDDQDAVSVSIPKEDFVKATNLMLKKLP